MMLLQQYYRQLAVFFNSRNLRERILIAGLVTAVIINGWLYLLHDSEVFAQEQYNQQLASLKQQIKATDTQYNILLVAKQVDPNRETKQRLALAQQHINKLDKQLHLKMDGLIKPTQMAKVLEQILTQQTQLRFVRIQSLPAKPLIIPIVTADTKKETPATTLMPKPDLAQTEIGVYKHGIEMEFKGSYLETLSYLKQLQQLPWNFYWDAILFDVIRYPQSRIIIRVHTLSLKEGWIGV